MKNLILLITLTFFSWNSALGQTWQVLVQQAQKVYLEYDFKTALVLIDSAERKFNALGVQADTSYINLCCIRSGVERELGKFESAYAYADKAIKLSEQLVGRNSLTYVKAVYYHVVAHIKAASFNDSDSVLIEIMDIYKKNGAADDDDYYMQLKGTLASVYAKKSLYNKAEPLYLELHDFWLKKEGKLSKNYYKVLNNMAQLYVNEGQWVKAEKLQKESVELCLKLMGGQSTAYAAALNGLAATYVTLGKADMAIAVLEEAKPIIEKKYGKKHPFYGDCCNNMAGAYHVKADNENALLYYSEALVVAEVVFGKNSPDYGITCANISLVYMELGRMNEAEDMLLESIKIFRNTWGDKNMGSVRAFHDAGSFYKNNLNLNEAFKFYKEASEGYLHHLKTNMIHLAEKEKLYLIQLFAWHFNIYNSFVIQNDLSQHTDWLFDNILITKAIVFDESQRVKNRISASKDTLLQSAYQAMQDCNLNYSKYLQMTKTQLAEQQIDLDSIEKQAEALEKKVILRSQKLSEGNLLIDKQLDWKDIQQKLKKDEAVVELLRVYHNKRTDRYKDSICYLALIITPETKIRPEMVLLPNGSFLEKEAIEFYSNNILFNLTDTNSYANFWLPIKEKLKGVKRVYFSGDGIYHKINLLTLLNPKTKKYLDQETDIRLLSSSRDILKNSSQKKQKRDYSNYQAYLFGYPNYAKGLSSERKEQALEDSSQMNPLQKQRFFNLSLGQVSKLPGTKKEVEGIATVLRQQRIRATVYTEDNASEENIKSVQSPDLLHIATHGFFIEDEKINSSKEDIDYNSPLQRSGLLLAGVEASINGLNNPDAENGIFTAKEANNLNLATTHLVILSACETGLGHLQYGEGVYGLQRAFMAAGAQTILMSLWKIDDTATQELMTYFYKNMFMKKQEKRTAFKNAQRTLQKKYPSPYYWGSFVMLGE